MSSGSNGETPKTAVFQSFICPRTLGPPYPESNPQLGLLPVVLVASVRLPRRRVAVELDRPAQGRNRVGLLVVRVPGFRREDSRGEKVMLKQVHSRKATMYFTTARSVRNFAYIQFKFYQYKCLSSPTIKRAETLGSHPQTHF